MDAIICNAGKGTRLNENSRTPIKKCLIKDINSGKSILWYQLDALNHINVKNVFVVVSNDDLVIRVEVDRLAHRFPDMCIKCVTGPLTTSMIGSISTGLSYVKSKMVIKLDGDVCVMNSNDLDPLKNLKKNTLAVYEMDSCHKKSGTPVLTQSMNLDFFENHPDVKYSWSCIDVWNTVDLKWIVDSSLISGTTGSLLENINHFIKYGDLKFNFVEIPSVYEVDNKDDLNIINNKWNDQSILLETVALDIWKSFIDYPKFDENKLERINIDVGFINKYYNMRNNKSYLDIGAGDGYVFQSILSQICPETYIAVEPNMIYCNKILKYVDSYKNINIFVKNINFHEYVDNCDNVDFTVMFGSLMYMLNDENLRKSLLKLSSQSLLIKTPSPFDEFYDRLFINDFSKNLNSRYTALYRNINDVCEILKSSGWCVKNIERNIYSTNIDPFKSMTNIIYCERPK